MPTRIPVTSRVPTSSTTTATTRMTAACPPPCPACGGLECLCRPRFYAGQLLTEQDLNRLDAYVRAKNRLHNRYLHGWGVVCGLEATCHNCDNLVQVSAGYGLSPCGDDVIVCDDTTVDVCELIRQCTRASRTTNCNPPRQTDTSCSGGDETWVLAICYSETAQRQMPALGGSSCSCGCGGSGGGGGGGCGCGGKKKTSGGGCGCGGSGGRTMTTTTSMTSASSSSTSPAASLTAAGYSSAAVQCEPTVVCEGYTFRVYRAPEPALTDSRVPKGAFTDRAGACLTPYMEWIKALASSIKQVQSQQAGNTLCCRAKARLRAILLQTPRHDCTLLDDLDAVVCPASSLAQADFNQAFGDAFTALMEIWMRGAMDCLCSALLPPCPGPVDDDCIPLATVTVSKSDCTLLRVCNWSAARKLATTMPALQYWLSILPFGRYLRALIEEVCCTNPFADQQQQQPQQPPSAAAGTPDTTIPLADFRKTTGAGTGPMPFSTSETSDMSTLLATALVGRTTPLDPETLFRSIGGVPPGGTADGRTLRDFELANVPQYFLANRLVQPFVSAAVPADLSGLSVLAFGAAAARGFTIPTGGTPSPAAGTAAPSAPAPATASDVDALRLDLDALRQTVDAQRTTIDQLNQRLGGR